MSANQPLRLVCSQLDAEGAATAPAEGVEWHVAGALPGETVTATPEHVSPHRRGSGRVGWARLQTIETASPHRVPPPCPGFGRCGGCPVQHLAYNQQLAWKTETVRRALDAFMSAGTAVEAMWPSSLQLGYRNQGKYAVAGRPGQVQLGAFVPRSHEVVDLIGCRIVESAVDNTARLVRDVLSETGLAPYDERTRSGILRHVAVRANARGRTLITIVSADSEGRTDPLLAAAARQIAATPDVAGVVLNRNAGAGNAVFGAEEHRLVGDAHLPDSLAGVSVRLSSRSFFQLNRAMAARAYEAIRARVTALGPVRRAVDAYGGVGGIALALASVADEVTSIEINADASADAAATARAQGLRVTTIAADAAAGLERTSAAEVVVLNPPRAGCTTDVLAEVVRLRPALVPYLSCNPATLARDVALLTRAGLRLVEVQPLDMLPHTTHTETLATLVS